jgi:hypothetical protein
MYDRCSETLKIQALLSSGVAHKNAHRTVLLKVVYALAANSVPNNRPRAKRPDQSLDN